MEKNKTKRMMKEVDYFENIDDNKVQYSSIEAAIEAHAKTYSFNIESKLFPQLTKEQQKLWRKEIEQACIRGGDVFIDKACQFIKEHHHEFSFWNTEEYELGFSTQKFIDDFKKYMEKE